MPKSYRFRTEIGVDREVRLNIEQDFDQLEILSLKLRQEDIYSRFCADYGVVAGRVVANGGFGIPNVSVSIFIPLDDIDEDDPVISALYPYKRPNDKNEDGYRYNLLPYVQENSGHSPTGTFPTRSDILTRKEVLEIYDKYYKFTVRTNQSGDFMIVGVPLGEQKLVMDLDLSNIGKFSLRPDDLIRMGLGVPQQFNGNRYKASENLDSLPQIINQVYDITVSSFWGEEELCDVGITRIDMDLRDFGIEIQPRCIFMGSLFSSSDDDYIKGNCKPKNDVGKLCDVTTGPGQILAIRHGFGNDENGLPVLEEYKLDDSGYVVDENGVWITELPMNLRYITTNEFGEEIESIDEGIGIPTEAKYRFKVKWMAEDGLLNEIQRANYLIPNIKEHGWDGPFTINRPTDDELNKSYAFSLSWDDYYDVPAAVKCEDTFYHFYYNKVYTVASHIDRFKWGWGRQKHYGIKEINDKKCQGEVNKFPVNDAQRNGKLLIFLFNLIISLYIPQVIQTIINLHILAVLWEIFKIFVNIFRIFINFIYSTLCVVVVLIANIVTLGFSRLKFSDCFEPLIPKITGNPFKNISIPMLTYPDCDLCRCRMDGVDPTDSESVQEWLEALDSFPASTALFEVADGMTYNHDLCYYKTDGDINEPTADMEEMKQEKLRTQAQLVASGYDKRTDKYYETLFKGNNDEGDWYKSPVYPIYNNNPKAKIDKWKLNTNPTWAQALNLMNRRGTYFFNSNLYSDPLFKASTAIKIEYVNDQLGPSNSDPVYDKAFIILSKSRLEQGQLITFNDIEKVNDWNIGKTGHTIHNETQYQTVQISGIDPEGNNYTSNVQIYNPTSGATYLHTAGVEYFQVITSKTLNDMYGNIQWNGVYGSVIRDVIHGWRVRWGCSDTQSEMAEYDRQIKDTMTDFSQRFFVTIMVRGVDPRGTRQKIKYDLSRLFGHGVDNSFGNNGGLSAEFTNSVTVTGDFYMNVPIQPNTGGTNNSVWRYNNMTPAPHYRYMDDNELNFTNANNNNLTSASGSNFPSMSTPNLFNSSFMFYFDETTNWGTFYSQAPTKYVSLDKSFENHDPLDNGYFGSGDDTNFKYSRHKTNHDNKNRILYFMGIGDSSDRQDSSLYQYDPQRRIEGCGYQYSRVGGNLTVGTGPDVITISSLYLNSDANLGDPFDNAGQQPKTYFPNKNNLVMRSDRIPAGDYWDEASVDALEDGGHEGSIVFRRYGLHLSMTQTMFAVSDDGQSESLGSEPLFYDIFDSSGDSADAEDDNEDYGLESSLTSNLISSFGCEHMVPFECYQGNGEDFEVVDAEDCEVNDLLNIYANTRVVNGCYNFVTEKLILSIPEDIKHFFEWRTRMRFMFAICNGIIGEMFQNNWVNGTLYMPSFQKKTYYFGNPNEDNFNQVKRYKYCGDPQQNSDSLKHQGPLYYNTQTNSFYYRSTPYNDNSNEFVGQIPARDRYPGQNGKNIWFPTTISELGPKNQFIYEVTFDPQFEAYIMDRLRSTSYGENSNLVNILVVSRLRNARFFENLLNLGDASIGQLFSREEGESRFYDGRIDGDYAQLTSIASELGVIPFLEGDYTDSQVYFDSDNIGVWFESDTILRRKLTNGAMTYGLDPEGPDYVYGFDKTQEVPYYMWSIRNDSPDVNLFGTEFNSWNTEKIYSGLYQGDDFFNNTPTTYMKPDYGYGLGHIYNRSLADETFNQYPGNNPNPTGQFSEGDFKVGNPFHFYFGLKRGKTAITKFIKNYIEIV